jgi:hypothetical protein
VVVITSRREKNRLPPVTLRSFEAENSRIKRDGAFQVSNFEMDVPNARPYVDGAEAVQSLVTWIHECRLR